MGKPVTKPGAPKKGPKSGRQPAGGVKRDNSSFKGEGKGKKMRSTDGATRAKAGGGRGGGDDDDAPPLEGPDARAPMSDAARAALDRARTDAAYLDTLTDKKLRGQLRHVEGVYAGGAVAAARAGEWLMPASAGALEADEARGERTWRLGQRDLAEQVPSGAARKAFDLALPDLGPYCLAFSRAGRHVLLGGARGHLAVLEWGKAHLTCELQVKEAVRDACFLHSEQYFCAAQKKRAYIYDKRGVELHALDAHAEPRALQFLPHHFLLASAGGDASGSLVYQDVSTGQLAAQHKTRLGPCSVLAQNPHNAVLVAGHTNGTATFWSPNQSAPLVRMLVHRGPLRAACVDPTGRYLVTAGADRRVKVWDVRTYAPLHEYLCDAAPTSVDCSQRGLLAVAMGCKVQVWPAGGLGAKAQSPYLSHALPTGAARTVRFCPYEDVLAAGAAGGLSTMLVPGAGEPNFDSWVANPLASLRERRAQEVAQLLDKLQPDTISLDPGGAGGVGALAREPAAVAAERSAEASAANAARVREARGKADGRKRMKGKNKPTRRQHRKQTNVVEDRKPAAGKALEREQERRAAAAEAAAGEREGALQREVPATLHRFYR